MCSKLSFVPFAPQQQLSFRSGLFYGSPIQHSRIGFAVGYRLLPVPGRTSLPFSHRRQNGSPVMVAFPGLPASINPTVFRSSVLAIKKLLVTLLFGVLAAKRGLLDPATLGALSKTVFAIFLPSLIFTNVVQTLAQGPVASLFWLPFVAMLHVLIGLVVGVLLSSLLRLNDSERRIFIVCSGFGNSAALPLLFINALFDKAPAQLAGMISSVSFYLIGWTGLFWSVGYSVLAGISNPSASQTSNLQKSSEGSILKNAAERVLSPPLIAALCGLAIGLVPPVRTIFVSSPAFSALQTLGSGYSPAAVLILAGSLARKVPPPDPSKRADPSSTVRLRRLVIGISTCRYLFMPILGLMAVRFGVQLFTTPFVKFAILLEAIMPPAQNSTLILNLERKPDAAATVARILLAVYLIGVLPISVGLTYFLGVAGV